MSTNRVPSYRRHKPSGQAVVTLDGRDFYLGKFNSAASRSEYNRRIAEWAAHDGIIPDSTDLSITELLRGFSVHAERYYRGPDGKPTTEVANFKPIVRRLRKMYGDTSAAAFGPIALKAVRQSMINEKLARRTINHATNRIRRIFKWAVENEIVPASVIHGLQAVSGLKYGRSDARETEPIKPVPDAYVDAVLPYVAAQVAAMLNLQRVTGMRSGEVTIMRACDINMAGRVWEYTPAAHKTAYRGHSRTVYLGPKAQAIIKPFLKTDLQGYLFSPAEANDQRNSCRLGVSRPDRKTPIYPSELRSRERLRLARAGRKSRRPKGGRYRTDSYWQAVSYGIDATNKALVKAAVACGLDPDSADTIPSWHPHQLRHNAATALRREYGIEVARIILGHKSPAITEVYAEVDHARAIDVMASVG